MSNQSTMAFHPRKKNKQIMINNIQEEDPAKSQNESATRMNRSNIVEQSDIINMNGSVSSGSVNGERASFININRLKLFGHRGSGSNSTATTHENEDKPIDSEVDCTLRLGFPTEPQQQVQLNPQGGDDHLSAIINNYFAPNNVVPKGLMQNYEVMNERTPLYHKHSQDQHINNRFVMNNFNQNNYQLQQHIMNNKIVGNNGMPLGGGSPSAMNVGGNSNSSSMTVNNHGMFHGGGSTPTVNVGGNISCNNNSMFVNNHGMFHGGGSPSTMNVGGHSSNSNNNLVVNNHGMFYGGGSPSTMNVGVSSSNINNNLVVNNHGMFGGSHNNMIVNDHGMFHGGGGIPSTMNVRGNSNSNNFGMFHGGIGGGDLSSVVVALPSPGVGSLGDGLNSYNIPYPLPPPPPNNFHVAFPNNNIPPPFPTPQLPPAPPVFLAAPRRNVPYPHNYAPQPEPENRCFACNTTRTPLWRNGPKGPKSLCNACGIRYKKEVRRIRSMMVVSKETGETSSKA